jgi:hypothetical protein
MEKKMQELKFLAVKSFFRNIQATFYGSLVLAMDTIHLLET